MINKKVYLREDDENVTLDCFITELCSKRDALLVIPGGGYFHVCYDREGHRVAEEFIPKGFNCFVLNYSTGEKAKYPRPLEDASLAIKYIKEHADELNINPDRVFALGFSAGGHLTGMLGTMWHKVSVGEYGINKPTGVVLCYPVLTSKPGHSHAGSFHNLLGTTTPTEEELKAVSIENNVDEKSAPAFLWHTSNDPIVPVESSLYTALKYKEYGIPFELHVFPNGPHGMALGKETSANGNPEYIDDTVAQWPSLAADWMKNIK